MKHPKNVKVFHDDRKQFALAAAAAVAAVSLVHQRNLRHETTTTRTPMSRPYCVISREGLFFLVVVFSLFYFDRRQTVKKVKVLRSHLRVCVCVCERVKNNNTIAPRVYY